MKHRGALALVPLVVGVWALAQAPQPQRSLARYVPPGAILLLESRDFAALVRDWNASPEKKLWLASDNYRAFSRSRLFLRLGDAQREFAGVAGVPPDMSLLEAAAGGESALALYDTGNLEFLYITRLAAARAMESALWQSRARFQSRASAGQPYYVRSDPATNRVAAFAAMNDWLLLATREEALAGALALLANQKAPALEQEAWFAAAARQAGQPGDLRLVLNVPKLAESPHFRSYWIQRNVSELRQYGAAISDLRFSAREVREERVLLRAQPVAARDGAGVATLLRLAPDAAGLARAWAAPAPEEVVALLEGRILAPQAGTGGASRHAPGGSVDAPEAGSSDDLETLIDQPPLAGAQPVFAAGALRRVMESAKPEAVLVVESTRPAPQGVFVASDAAVAILSPAIWNGAAVRDAAAEAIRGLFSVSGLGLNWVERRHGGQVYHECDGLLRVAMAASGRTLLLARSAEVLTPLLDRLQTAPGSAAGVYEARYRHSRELGPLTRWMRLADRGANTQPAQSDGEAPAEREPEFFSENLASLGRVLGRVDSVAVSARDRGGAVSQTVVYRLGK